MRGLIFQPDADSQQEYRPCDEHYGRSDCIKPKQCLQIHITTTIQLANTFLDHHDGRNAPFIGLIALL